MKKSTPWLVSSLLVAGLLIVAVATTVALTSTPDLRRALDAQRLLVQENPYDARAFNDLGNLLTLAGDDGGAEVAYRRAVELAPEATSPRYNLGLLLQSQRRHGEALTEFQAVLGHDPGNAWARYQVGAIYEAEGETSRAIRWYGEAFSLDPQLAFPEYNPSVIENGLVDEAMLRGYRSEGSRSLAPKVYEEPRRIQSLMLPLAPDELPAAATEAAGPGDEERAMSDREVLASPSGAADPGSPGPGTLDSGDLDRRRVNQAGAGGGSPSRYGSTPPSRSQGRSWQRPPSTPQPSSASGRQPTAQGGTVVIQGTGGSKSTDPTAPGTRVRTPRGRTGFTPGIASTSRLELQLVPTGADRRG